MSSTLPILNGDKSGVGDFATDASVNMVAAIHDHISCTKPVHVTQDTKGGIVFPFDHMYASLAEGSVVGGENLEVKHLKELLLLHLDLIQQQSEQLVTKDKQISSLRQENETLRLRLERMDRRVKLRDADASVAAPAVDLLPPVDATAPAAPSQIPPPAPALADAAATVSDATGEESCEPAKRRRTEGGDEGRASSPSSLQLQGGDQSSDGTEPTSRRRRGRTSGPWTSQKRRRGRPAGAGGSSGRRASRSSRGGRYRRVASAQRRGVRLATRGGVTVPATVALSGRPLSADAPYWNNVGDLPPALRPLEVAGSRDAPVEVPSWRHKVYTSCYTMEGTENLDDDVFGKRHQRYEVDERRRKRWDVQRIREQRHLEKLRQREAARAGGGRSDGGGGSTGPLPSLWPAVDDLAYVEVVDSLPVAAFGSLVTDYLPSEFSLPWKLRSPCDLVLSLRRTCDATSPDRR